MKSECFSKDSFDLPQYIAPSAWLEHIPFAFFLIEKLKPKSIVELGVHYGVSYFSFCQAVKKNHLTTSCYAVDNWKGDEHAGFYDEEIYDLVKSYNSQYYADFSVLLRQDFEDALTSVDEKSVDILHIDGLHTYEAAKKDFETWRSKLSDTSVVLFHDITRQDERFGVYRLWEELAKIFPSFSFLHSFGLGILATGNHIPSGLVPLFQCSVEETQAVRHGYQQLGNRVSEKMIMQHAIQKVEELEKEKEIIQFNWDSATNEAGTVLIAFNEERIGLQREIAVGHARLQTLTEENAKQAEVIEENQVALTAKEKIILELQAKIEACNIDARRVMAENDSHQQIIKENLIKIKKIEEKEVLDQHAFNILQAERTALKLKCVQLEAAIVENSTQLELCSSARLLLEKDISYYRNSKSWKITRPLRSINQKIQQLVNKRDS